MFNLIRGIIVSVLLLGLLVTPFGTFAYDRGLYLESDNDTETGLYYTVKRDRALGPDRILYRTSIAKEAWQVFLLFKQMDAPPKLFNFVQPAPPEEGP